MASTIEKITVAEDRFAQEWGVRVNDYEMNGVKNDLQDLLVNISQERASAIEAEVVPMETIITRRNEKLSNYGKVLQKLTELQAQFTEDQSQGTVDISSVCDENFTTKDFWALLEELGHSGGGSGSSLTTGKAEAEGLVSRCKSTIDEMNNESQKDMNRLQSLVDRRDESYSTATSLMTSVSDTRSSLIKNLN